MKKKELEQRLENLKKDFMELASIVNNHNSLINVLCTQDRFGVEISPNRVGPVATFIWGCEVHHIVLPHDVNNKCVYSVFDNSPTSCIIMADNFICPTYYKLDKTTQSLVDVTEFYKRAEFERMAKSCELETEKKLTEEKCDCKCKKGGKK